MEKHLVTLRREGAISEWHDRAIAAGQEWDRQINHYLDAADIILLLVSPDFLASDYCYDVEVRRAMERHEAGEARVIPVILRRCGWTRSPFAKLQALPKDALPVRRWPDLDEAFHDVAEGIRRAAEELRARRARPAPAPAPSAAPARPSPADIPPPPAVGFVARRDKHGKDLVARLREELAPGGGRLVALWGPGGSGKAALAAEVVRSLGEEFGGRVAWVGALGRAGFSLLSLLDDLAGRFGRADLRTLAPEKREEQVRSLVSAAPTLVVLDDLQSAERAEQMRCASFLVSCAGCSALVTTREAVKRDDTLNLGLGAMEPDEAHELLRRLIADARRPSAFARLDRDALVRECGASPLVIQWAVGQLTLARRDEDVLGELRGDPGETRRSPGGVAARVFTRAFNLPQLGDDGRATILALSLFTPDATRELLVAAAGLQDDLPRLERALSTLSALRLVEGVDEGERLRLPGLTRRFARGFVKQTPADVADFPGLFAASLFFYAKAHADGTEENFEAMERERENLFVALEVSFAAKNWLPATVLRSMMERFLNARGYWDAAVRTGAQALQAAREIKEEDMVAVLSHNLAVTHQRRGEFEEARRLYGESLEIKQRKGDEAGAALGFNQLAEIAAETGDADEARRLYGQSLELSRRAGDDYLRSKVLKELGALAGKAGDFGEARRLYAERVGVKESLGDRLGAAFTLHQLAYVTERTGDRAEAARLYRESLARLERLGSPEARIARSNVKRLERAGF